MSLFELGSSIVGSLFSGGLTGLLGIGLQGITSYFTKKQELAELKLKQDHDIEVIRANAEVMKEEWAQRTKLAEVEGATQVEVAAEGSFKESYSLEPKLFSVNVTAPSKIESFMLVLLDFIRGLIRPGLTIYLCVLTTLIYFEARDLIYKENLDTLQALDLTETVINTVLYLFVTCTLWYFGIRNNEKAPKIK